MTDNLVVQAIVNSAKSKESRALANLNNYLTNAVGVGEHPDIVAECEKLVKQVIEAREIIAGCEKIFKITPTKRNVEEK